jgi:glyoxylase-like metal-dependent hydrolase (beta-lactamase superfamily II)
MAQIKVQIFKNSPIDSNCFILTNVLNNKALIIDPGCQDNTSLISLLSSIKVDVEFIILSHEHFDHIWSVNILRNLFSCKIICSTECAERIADRKKNMSVFYNQKGFEVYSPDLRFDTEKYLLDWNGIDVELIKTKGHSEGSISVLINDLLFTGDTVIKDKKTVLKLPESDRNKLISSLNLLESLCNQWTTIFPGHGESFLVDDRTFRNCL